jgi:hypothetical protein
MIELLKGKRFPDQLFIFAAIAFAVGLSTSKVILSISSMLLVLAVFLKGDLRSLRTKIRANDVLILLLLYLLLHVVALLWTSDFSYASNDLKTKLTLLIVPVAFTIYPLEKTTLNRILFFFVTGVVVTSAVNVLSWYHVLGKKQYTDIRELSLFGSHIRYGILVAMATGICFFSIKKAGTSVRLFLVTLFAWFSYYTYFSQIVSGMLALITAIVGLIFWFAYQKSKILAFSTLILPIGLMFLAVISLQRSNQIGDLSRFKTLPSVTANGNPYTHNMEPGTFIDGKPFLAFLCEKELRQSWNKVSNLSYDGKDRKGQLIKFTLMRFMTDLNVRKDSVGFQKLNKGDISLIEKGIASREEGEGGLWARWNGVKFQLQNNIDPNGHSMLQRIEYWKTAWKIIQKNYLIGVGTGDVQQAFDWQYAQDNSRLLPEYRLRAHNTYLTSWISFGIFGLFVLLWMILSFLGSSLRHTSPLAFLFMLVAASTFLLEDTLETQMGASFFAFFFGLFCAEGEDY